MELDPSIGSIFWVGEMRQSQVNALTLWLGSAMALRFLGKFTVIYSGETVDSSGKHKRATKKIACKNTLEDRF